MTIGEQINAVVDAREKASELKGQRDALLEGWNEANQELLDALTQAGADVAEAEAKLRELAIQVYAETKEKNVAPGVGIRVMTKMEYDTKAAMEWAVKHSLALVLDKKAFEAIAKTTPLDFVVSIEEPTATIAAVLDRIKEVK